MNNNQKIFFTIAIIALGIFAWQTEFFETFSALPLNTTIEELCNMTNGTISYNSSPMVGTHCLDYTNETCPEGCTALPSGYCIGNLTGVLLDTVCYCPSGMIWTDDQGCIDEQTTTEIRCMPNCQGNSCSNQTVCLGPNCVQVTWVCITPITFECVVDSQGDCVSNAIKYRKHYNGTCEKELFTPSFTGFPQSDLFDTLAECENATLECTQDSDCSSTYTSFNDCSLFWKAENLTRIGSCISGACSYLFYHMQPPFYHMQPPICTPTQLWLQKYIYYLIVLGAGIVIVGYYFVFEKGPKKGMIKKRKKK